jgi:hypothetical protein
MKKISIEKFSMQKQPSRISSSALTKKYRVFFLLPIPFTILLTVSTGLQKVKIRSFGFSDA